MHSLLLTPCHLPEVHTLQSLVIMSIRLHTERQLIFPAAINTTPTATLNALQQAVDRAYLKEPQAMSVPGCAEHKLTHLSS